MIAELFYPKELKEIIADLRAKDDLNEEALSKTQELKNIFRLVGIYTKYYFMIVIGLLLIIAVPVTASARNTIIDEEKCKRVRSLVIAENKENIHDFVVPHKGISGGTDIYINIDIDRDGIEDSIVRSRGYGQDKIQFLFIAFSKTGQEIELELNPFYIIGYENEFLVIESNNRIFLLKPDDVVEVCNLN